MLIERVHLLEVLVLNFDRHEQLDALVVLQLVTRYKGRRRARREVASGGGGRVGVARSRLRVVLRCRRLHVRVVELLIFL